jgi:hypothetical protein
MKLIYRTQIIEYTPRPEKAYRKPYALNWRFHVPGESYGNDPISLPIYQEPRALNWRFCMGVGD